jgi:hypothetical protein
MRRRIALIVLTVLIGTLSATASYLTYRSWQNTDSNIPIPTLSPTPSSRVQPTSTPIYSNITCFVSYYEEYREYDSHIDLTTIKFNIQIIPNVTTNTGLTFRMYYNEFYLKEGGVIVPNQTTKWGADAIILLKPNYTDGSNPIVQIKGNYESKNCELAYDNFPTTVKWIKGN